MLNYQFNQAKYGTHRLILSWIGKNKLVLDVGCSSGYLGIHSRESKFYGIEVDKKEAKKARKVYKKVFVGDVEKLINSPLSLPKFDVIIFADILEHLVHPQKTLTYLVTNFLKDDGKTIISLPNVAHLSVRLNLLAGKFDYTEAGILDKTHLHLYSLKSANKLINKSGLKTENVVYSSNKFGWLIKECSFLGTILGFNLIFLCRKEGK